MILDRFLILNYIPLRCRHIIPGEHQTKFRYLNQCCNLSQSSDARSEPEQKNLFHDVVPRVGLEVHAQLDIKSKLFSRGGNSVQASSNSLLDLFDVSLPGTLPKLNRNALRASLLTSLGLNCELQDMINFDRKNYFYTDMPAGYQITQYSNPIAKNGYIDFIVTTYHKSNAAHSQRYDIMKYLDLRSDIDQFKPYVKRSRIKQVQLEQDSAKTLHENFDDPNVAKFNLVDYNRCGSGLIEIVFEPDLSNHHEASSLIKELIIVLKALGTCQCEFQEGSMRVDANISIKSIAGQDIDQSGRVELKNLNSLRSLNKGIFHEIQRQANLIKEGKIIVQESRSFDPRSGQTIPLRVKEETADYRYVPEPNIPPLRIDAEMIDKVKSDLPSNMPSYERDSLITDYNMDLSLVTMIMEVPGLSDYFKKIMLDKACYDANVVADFLVYTVSGLKSIVGLAVEVDFTDGSELMLRLNPETMQAVFDMMFDDEISFTIAYEVIKYIVATNDSSEPRKIVDEMGWYQINDQSKVEELCTEVIIGMKSISKKYAKRGHKRYLRMMLDKLCELTNNKISIKRAIKCINERLKPPQAI